MENGRHPETEMSYRRRRKRRPTTEIRLLPPTFVPMPEEEVSEVVEMLADILIDAIKRQQREQGAGSATQDDARCGA